MKFSKYINELSMRKGTHVSSPEYRPNSIYNQNIVLEDGIKFLFSGYYFIGTGIWELQFEDEDARTDLVSKRKGAAMELFAALEKVMMQFIDKALPDKFEFRADLVEKSRVKLYDLIAKKIKKKYGFKYTRVKTGISVLYQFMHKSVQGKWTDSI